LFDVCCHFGVHVCLRASCRDDCHHIDLRWEKADAKASDAKPEPVEKIGLVVNLGERTVSGFATVARIAKVDAAHISFGNTVKRSLLNFRSEPAASVTIIGDIDRVTRAVSATIITTATASSYDLICKPTSRLF